MAARARPQNIYSASCWSLDVREARNEARRKQNQEAGAGSTICRFTVRERSQQGIGRSTGGLARRGRCL